MLNNIYKKIHNKYSTLFKFIFFLRYLFGIFFISVVLFITIPHFVDFKKNSEIFQKYLLEAYGLKLNKYENIKYNSLPTPRLEIQNAELNIEQDSLKINVKNLIIYPKLLSIYNYKNFEIKKIILDKSKISLSDSDLVILINYFHNLKNKITFKELDLTINKNIEFLLRLEKIYLTNFGYNKNIIKGKIFDKKFKISVSSEYDNINFKLLKTGITININFNKVKKASQISGIFKSKFLNSNLKFNFDYDDKKLKIYNSYFRNKDLSFSNESSITYRPFFNSRSIFKLEDINLKILKEINFNKILTSKKLIQKINTQNKIHFKSKKFNNKLIDDLDLNIDLNYGRLIYSKKILILENLFLCEGNINLLEENPILYFDCSIDSKDKKKFLKEFSIKYKSKNESFKLNVKGNINILNNRINFKIITMNKDYKATKEDLNYFAKKFEDILFDKNFFEIFNFEKIKDFILEIS